MHIAHIDQKIWIFKNRQAKNLKIFGVKLGIENLHTGVLTEIGPIQGWAYT